jgi:hypothetical protein
VSLLERFARGHLNDAQFARVWSGDPDAGAVHPHLDRCADCRARYESFRHWASDLGEELRDEADGAFTAERLAVQQAQIARRLETLERPARVIAFPKAARAVISGNSHVRRWVTVGAAAGLIAGVGLGQVVPLRRAIDARPNIASGASFNGPAAAQRANDIRAVSNSQNDDELLSDAFSRPRVSTLSALDDMTPHARDFVDSPK